MQIENRHGSDGANHVIRRCTFTGHEENGVDFKGARPSSANEGPSHVHHCEFTNHVDGHLIIHYGARDILIERNTFLNGHSAISVNTKVEDVNDGYITIQYNLIVNQSSVAIWNSSSGGLGHNKVVNNTIYNVGFDNSNNFSIQINTNNWVIKNNIFYHLSIGKAPHSTVRFLSDVDMNTIDVDNNCHLQYSGTSAYRMPDDAYQTVEQVESNGIQADPLFVDAAGGNYHLGEGSPCFGLGVLVDDVHPAYNLNDVLIGAAG